MSPYCNVDRNASVLDVMGREGCIYSEPRHDQRVSIGSFGLALI